MLTYLVTIAAVGYLCFKANALREAAQLPMDGVLASSVKRRRQESFYFWLAAAILIVVSGLRYGVGADYFAYSHTFYNRNYDFWSKIITFNEPGNALLIFVSRWLYFDFTTMTLLAALITVGLIFREIWRYSADFYFSALLFILAGNWHGSFNALRQYIAVAILFAALRFILEKKVVKYCMVVALAMCFHRTALFMLPCYFLLNIKDFRQYLWGLLVFGVLIYFSYDRFLEIMSDIKGVDQTTQGYSLRAVHALRVLMSFVPVILYYARPLRAVAQSPRHYLYLKLMMLNSTVLLSTSGSAYLARVAIYTDIYSVLTLPCIYKLYPAPTYRLYRALFITLYCIFWLVEVTRRETLLPFTWVFQR